MTVIKEIGHERRLRADGDGDFVRADVRVGYIIRAEASCAKGCEADLAICLATLVRAGVLDVEKLRAALVLAEPAARDKIGSGV